MATETPGAAPTTLPPSHLDPRASRPRRIEVTTESSADGRTQIVVRDLSFGPGVGWYAQKTIRLDPDQLEAVLGAICCIRQTLRSGGPAVPGCGATIPGGVPASLATTPPSQLPNPPSGAPRISPPEIIQFPRPSHRAN